MDFDTILFGKKYHWLDKQSTTEVEIDGLPAIRSELHRGVKNDCSDSACK